MKISFSLLFYFLVAQWKLHKYCLCGPLQNISITIVGESFHLPLGGDWTMAKTWKKNTWSRSQGEQRESNLLSNDSGFDSKISIKIPNSILYIEKDISIYRGPLLCGQNYMRPLTTFGRRTQNFLWFYGTYQAYKFLLFGDYQ